MWRARTAMLGRPVRSGWRAGLLFGRKKQFELARRMQNDVT